MSLIGGVGPTRTSHDMTHAQCLDLPDDLRAEYADGKALLRPAPSFSHQEVCLRPADLFRDQLRPDAVVAVGVGWERTHPRPTLRIPTSWSSAVGPSRTT